jgi:S-(hydroxymethyl)glutathione dehydrogenase/alcohol dehydrogenase
MMMKVRAAVAREIGGPMRVETVALRRPRAGEVLVENKASGLCHSDLSVLEGKSPRRFPIILGHEAAGVVVECGPGVTSLKVGDHVAGGPMAECRECANCRSGKTNQCLRSNVLKDAETTPFTLDGEPLNALTPVASFAHFTVAPEIYYSRVADDVPFEVACLFGCAVMTGLGSALLVADVTEGSTVAVFGLGGVGLNVVDGARHAGARMIIGVDRSPEKEAAAVEFGVTHFINPRETSDIAARITELTDGGADYSFECVGNAELMTVALRSTRPEWGTSVIVGADRRPMTAQPFDLMRGRTWKGAMMGGAKARTDTARFLQLLSDGKLHTHKLVTHRLKLEDINEGYDLMRKGEGLRSVVIY